MAPVFLPGKFHGQRRLEGYRLQGHKELDTTQHIPITLSLFCTSFYLHHQIQVQTQNIAAHSWARSRIALRGFQKWPLGNVPFWEKQMLCTATGKVHSRTSLLSQPGSQSRLQYLCVFLSQCCQDKLPKVWWLKQHTFIISQAKSPRRVSLS